MKKIGLIRPLLYSSRPVLTPVMNEANNSRTCSAVWVSTSPGTSSNGTPTSVLAPMQAGPTQVSTSRLKVVRDHLFTHYQGSRFPAEYRTRPGHPTSNTYTRRQKPRTTRPMCTAFCGLRTCPTPVLHIHRVMRVSTTIVSCRTNRRLQQFLGHEAMATRRCYYTFTSGLSKALLPAHAGQPTCRLARTSSRT